MRFILLAMTSIIQEQLWLPTKGLLDLVQLDYFIKFYLFRWIKHNKMNFQRHYKGQKACAVADLQAMTSGVPALYRWIRFCRLRG